MSGVIVINSPVVVRTLCQEENIIKVQEKRNEMSSPVSPVTAVKERVCTASSPAGYCIIIDNSSINRQTRCFPIKRLCHILKQQFGFITLHFISLSIYAIKLLLSTLREINQSDSSCLLIITISTSKEGVVNGTDGQCLSTKDIVNFFSDKNCPNLIGKPKVFLFQTVSFDQSDDKVKLTCTHQFESDYSSLPFLLQTLRDYSDSATTGSIFITTNNNNNNSSSSSLAVATGASNNVQLQEAYVLPVQSKLNEGSSSAIELCSILKLFIPVRELVINTFADQESLIIKTCQDIYTNKLVGGTGGVAGTIFTVTGLALIPVTLGISLILAGVGAGIGTAGGITALISTVSDAVSKNELKNLKALMELDLQLCTYINDIKYSLLEEKESAVLCCNGGIVGDDHLLVVESMDLIEIVTKSYKQLNSKEQPSIAWLKEMTNTRRKELEHVKTVFTKF